VSFNTFSQAAGRCGSLLGTKGLQVVEPLPFLQGTNLRLLGLTNQAHDAEPNGVAALWRLSPASAS
jgi:hypothetical protein